MVQRAETTELRNLGVSYYLNLGIEVAKSKLGVDVSWANDISHLPLTPELLSQIGIPGLSNFTKDDSTRYPKAARNYDGQPLIYTRQNEVLTQAAGADRLLFLINAATGMGQTSVYQLMKVRHPYTYHRIVTATNRQIRSDERTRQDKEKLLERSYDFYAAEKFTSANASDFFVERDEQWGFHYGTPVKNAHKALRSKAPVVCWIVSKKGIGNVGEWMSVHYPNIPIVTGFVLSEISIEELIGTRIMPKRPVDQWPERIADALVDISTIGDSDIVVLSPREDHEPTRAALATHLYLKALRAKKP